MYMGFIDCIVSLGQNSTIGFLEDIIVMLLRPMGGVRGMCSRPVDMEIAASEDSISFSRFFQYIIYMERIQNK